MRVPSQSDIDILRIVLFLLGEGEMPDAEWLDRLVGAGLIERMAGKPAGFFRHIQGRALRNA